MAKEKGRLLDEKLSEVPKKILEKKIEEKKQELEEAKRKFFNTKVKRISKEILYTFVISALLGFVLWAWLPQQFNFHRALAMGVLYFILFEELRLQNFFKQQ